MGIGILSLLVAACAQQQRLPPASPERPTSGMADFTLFVRPESITVRRGATGRFTVTVTPVSGFTARVRLVSSLLYETTTAFEPSTVDGGGGSSSLTVAPGRSAITGYYVLTITGIDGGISHMVTAQVAVR